MFFGVLLTIFICIIFKKCKIVLDEKCSKEEVIFCLLWYLLYFVSAMASAAYEVNFINEMSNWLTLFLLPVLVMAELGKRFLKNADGYLKNDLRKIGFKRIRSKTGFYILLTCMFYFGIVLMVFSLSEERSMIWGNLPQILVRLPLFFCIMLVTAAFTEEVFFRGILQRTLMDYLRRPWLAIVLASILFGLYHFPYAYYLWDNTVGNIMLSLKMILAEQAVFGLSFGLIYYKSGQNLWSSIILHAFSNAMIMSLGTVVGNWFYCICNGTALLLVLAYTLIKDTSLYDNSTVMIGLDIVQGFAVGMLLVGLLYSSRYGAKIRAFKHRLMKKQG